MSNSIHPTQIMMKDKKTAELENLKKLGVFSLADAKKAGVSQSKLSRLAEDERIIKLGSGFYMHPEASQDPGTIDYVIACRKFGARSFIGGLSALAFYRLIDEVPDRIWVIVPPEKRTIEALYRLIRSRGDLNVDVEETGSFRVSSLARTLVESLHYSSKIGQKIAISATRRALSNGQISLKELLECSRRLGLFSVVEKYWDLITME